MEDVDLRLDGNAAGGMLREVFAHDMTSAQVACASCGHVAMVGASPLYMAHPGPGGVLRCARCDQVLMVIVGVRGRWRLGAPGVHWIDIG